MTRSPVRRLIFSLLRRVLYTWVRSETINQSAFTLKLDRSKPVFYVLQQPVLQPRRNVKRAAMCRTCGRARVAQSREVIASHTHTHTHTHPAEKMH